jgi:phosphate transport system protein
MNNPPVVAERRAFTAGLAELNENMATLAELAELSIRKAVATLELGPVPTEGNQKDVFTLDQEIFALREQVVHSCVDLIALHAPVAKDLRLITTCLEISTDLDRIGRYSKDIVEITGMLGADVHGPASAIGDLKTMGNLTIEMVDRAIDAFSQRRADLVADIVRRDDPIDALHDKVFHEIIARIEDRSISARIGAEFILINRYFERLADHAVNIGLRVTYMISGDRPRVKGDVSGPTPGSIQ